MASKITVTGQVQKVRKIQNPDDANIQWVCLEIITGGSPVGPKGLPEPSKDIQFTILMNTKQFKKLKDSSAEANLQVEGSKVLIQGELILDLSYEILEGDIGVICFQAENLDVDKLQKYAEAETVQEAAAGVSEPKGLQTVMGERENPKQPTLAHITIKTGSIQIPSEYMERPPREEKITKAQQFYEEHGQFDEDIVLVKGESGLVLKDGYARYIAAKRLGIEELQVVCEKL